MWLGNSVTHVLGRSVLIVCDDDDDVRRIGRYPTGSQQQQQVREQEKAHSGSRHDNKRGVAEVAGR